MLVIGVMSGSSLDGVDLAACSFGRNENGHYHFHIEAAETIPYPDDWIWKLSDFHKKDFIDGSLLHQTYGQYLGQLIQAFQSRHSLSADLISCHGHTVYHHSGEGLSLQIGDASAIWAYTNLPVVHDFRQADLHLGGQGAPLAPVGDAFLFGNYDACLNLGGIANISYVSNKGQRLAFDVAPCNQILNYLAKEAGQLYDKGGGLASEGQLIPGLIAALNEIPFYKRRGPKSLDKQDIENQWLPLIQSFQANPVDKLRTFIEHLAQQIPESLEEENSKPPKSLLVTGGGVWNTFLIQKLQAYWPGKVELPEKDLIDFKEALIFAFLGWLRYNGKVNCLRSITGASRDHMAGNLYG